MTLRCYDVNNDVMRLVDKLKQGAVARCRERVLRAADKAEHYDKERIERRPEYTVTEHVKERRGL